jgi:hypothetical protein
VGVLPEGCDTEEMTVLVMSVTRDHFVGVDAEITSSVFDRHMFIYEIQICI